MGQASGGKLWRLKYCGDGTEKKLVLGTYPAISLAEARARRDQARRLIANGVDPAIEEQREKVRAKVSADNTFAIVARGFMAKRKQEGMTDTTAAKAEFLFAGLADLGRLPIARSTRSTSCHCCAGSKRAATWRPRSERCSSPVASSVMRWRPPG